MRHNGERTQTIACYRLAEIHVYVSVDLGSRVADAGTTAMQLVNWQACYLGRKNAPECKILEVFLEILVYLPDIPFQGRITPEMTEASEQV